MIDRSLRGGGAWGEARIFSGPEWVMAFGETTEWRSEFPEIIAGVCVLEFSVFFCRFDASFSKRLMGKKLSKKASTGERVLKPVQSF